MRDKLQNCTTKIPAHNWGLTSLNSQTRLAQAAGNKTKKGNGLQIGLVNVAKEMRGVQIGLWNKTGKRGLPIINMSWGKKN